MNCNPNTQYFQISAENLRSLYSVFFGGVVGDFSGPLLLIVIAIVYRKTQSVLPFRWYPLFLTSVSDFLCAKLRKTNTTKLLPFFPFPLTNILHLFIVNITLWLLLCASTYTLQMCLVEELYPLCFHTVSCFPMLKHRKKYTKHHIFLPMLLQILISLCSYINKKLVFNI